MPKTKVSIVVAARNEADGIRRTINCLLAQDYPEALREIIIVDDHSTDDTAAIIRSYKTVQLIQLNEDRPLNSYKKKAIEKGILEASGELIVTTDADCIMDTGWLSDIVNYFEANDYKMISSPVQFFEEKSIFERGQTLEFLYLIGLGASSIGNGQPSTCNGANLAYEKKVFYEAGGFKGIDDLASGDDELLLHKIASLYPGQIGFLKSRTAMVSTHARPTVEEFIRQRRRWASKSTKYKNKSIVLLGICIWLFNLSIFTNLLVGVFDSRFLIGGLAQLAFKIAAELVFLSALTRFICRQNLLLLLPLVSIFHVIYIIYIGIAGNSGKYLWKGRRVK